MTATKLLSTAFVAAGVLLAAQVAQAAPNLITNGGFEKLTNGDNEIVPGKTTGTDISSATGWYSSANKDNEGYPFLFFATNAVKTGFGDAWDGGQRYLWGASNGGASKWDGTSIAGGHYLVMDGDYHATAINQKVSGLVKGTTYALTFDWAAAQWWMATGPTTESLAITLGGTTLDTKTISLASTGFSGWMKTTLDFKWDGTSDVLSFLAQGGPAGAPPMALLDNVSLTAVPEPASMAVMAGGLAAFAGLGLGRMRRRTAA